MSETGRAATRVAALLLLSVPAAFAGCAAAGGMGESDLLAQGRVVNELRPGPSPAADSAAATPGDAGEAAAAADRAEALLAAGDSAGALEEVRAALLRNPPQAGAERLREVRLLAKRAFLRTSIARAAVGAPERETEGWPLRLRVSIHNLAPSPLVVDRPPAGASPATVRLRVVRTAYDVQGNVRSEEWEQLAPLETGTAPPGGSLSTEVVVETARFKDLLPHGFVTYDFGGEILVSATRVGQVDLSDRRPLEPARTFTFPQRGWREVAADPPAHLERGLAEGNPVRVLLAAACLPEAERAGAAAGLARRLRDGGPLGPQAEAGVRSALRFLAGDREADGWSVERWEARAAAAAAPGEGDR